MTTGSVVFVNFSVFASPEFREALLGVEIARIAAISLFTLALFDYLLTLNDERELFWKSSFSISHGLFFFNRYIPLMIMMITVVCFSVSAPTPTFCEATIQMTFLLSVIAICVIEAILITRVWCLFPGSPLIKTALVGGFIGTIASSLSFLFLSASDLQILVIMPDPRLQSIMGCRAARPDGFWRIYLPSLILHTAIYLLTVYTTITKVDRKAGGLRQRFVTDGGIFYFIVLFTVLFTTIGAFLTDVPRLNIPATFSPIVVGLQSIATGRIMMNLREETARYASNAEWFILSPTPLGTSASRDSMQKISPTTSYLHV